MIEAFSRCAMRKRISNAALLEAANRERRGPIDADLAQAGMIVLGAGARPVWHPHAGQYK